jgi:hypothetical protein
MRTSPLLMPLLALSCTLGESKLTLTVDSEKLVADGETPTLVTVCNESVEPADVTAVLRASFGSWEGALESDAQSIELPLSAAAVCNSAAWIPPSKAGQVRFEVVVGGVAHARQSLQLLEASVTTVDIKGGLLSEDDVSALTLTADFTTVSGGTATDGTVVMLEVTSDPVGRAYLSDRSIVVGKRDQVTLYAPAGTASVDVRATVEGSPDVTGCRRFSTTTIQACP